MKSMKIIFALLSAALLVGACGPSSVAEEASVGLIPVIDGKEFQYIDTEGKIVINPQFGEADLFRDGLALVRSGGSDPKYGFIDEDGKYAIMAIYVEATSFSDGLAWVVADDASPSAIDKTGKTILNLEQAQRVKIFTDGLAGFMDKTERKWGFINKKGEVVIHPQYSDVRHFAEGKCAVRNDKGKWGYIDTEGTLTISYQFEEAQTFKSGNAVVSFGMKYGLIDKSGKYTINPQFDMLLQDGSLCLVRQERKFGWCDLEGKIMINPQFEAALPFSGTGLAPVKLNGEWGFIDKEGKIAINPQFQSAYPFSSGIALVVENKRVGFVNDQGKYVINPQFDAPSMDYISALMGGPPVHHEVSAGFSGSYSPFRR